MEDGTARRPLAYIHMCAHMHTHMHEPIYACTNIYTYAYTCIYIQKEKRTYGFKNRMDVEEDLTSELVNAQTKIHRWMQKQRKHSKIHGTGCCQTDDIRMAGI